MEGISVWSSPSRGDDTLTSPDVRARAPVGLALVSVGVDGNAGVALGGVAGNVGEIVTTGLCRARASDLDLSALSVELRVQGLVKSEQLVANEVVAWCQRTGDLGLPVQLLEDLGCAPGGAAEGWCGHALLVNL